MDEEYKKPEFIYVDEPFEDDINAGVEEQRFFSAIGEMHKAKFPIWLRVVSLLGCIFFGAVGVAVGFLAAFWFAVSLITLFKMSWPYNQFNKAYKLATKCLVLCIGLLIAVFSPPLGFGMIMMYFLMAGENINDSILKAMTRGPNVDN